MSIDENFRLINYIAGKNQKGNITPENFNLIIKEANSQYMAFCLGQIEQFQYNNPKPRVALGGSELVTSKLSPFISSPTSLSINGSGKANYPSDYVERIALYTSSGSGIRWAAQERLSDYLDDPIDPVATNPIYLLEDVGFMFYPITLGSARLSYVKNGAIPYWGYNVSGSLLTLTGLNGGTGYVDNTYLNIPLQGGYGINALATVIVVGGIVTSVTITNSGANFVVSNILTTDNSYLGGTGTGFNIIVGTVSSSQRAVYNPSTSQDLLWKEKDQMEVIARVLDKVGVNLIASQISQYANEVKTVGV